MAIFRWVITLIFLFMMVFFGVKNMGPVDVDYYFDTVRMPLFLLMAILILLGACLSALIGIADQLRLHARIRSQAKRIKTLEDELASLGRHPTSGSSGEDEEEDGSSA